MRTAISRGNVETSLLRARQRDAEGSFRVSWTVAGSCDVRHLVCESHDDAMAAFFKVSTELRAKLTMLRVDERKAGRWETRTRRGVSRDMQLRHRADMRKAIEADRRAARAGSTSSRDPKVLRRLADQKWRGVR